jgi:hypothetical protein
MTMLNTFNLFGLFAYVCALRKEDHFLSAHENEIGRVTHVECISNTFVTVVNSFFYYELLIAIFEDFIVMLYLLANKKNLIREFYIFKSDAYFYHCLLIFYFPFCSETQSHATHI